MKHLSKLCQNHQKAKKQDCFCNHEWLKEHLSKEIESHDYRNNGGAIVDSDRIYFRAASQQTMMPYIFWPKHLVALSLKLLDLQWLSG